ERKSERARRLDAELGALRTATGRIQRQRLARRDPRARDRRASVALRLGALRRPHRRDDRHARLRRLGASQGSAEEVRVLARARRASGERTNCQVREAPVSDHTESIMPDYVDPTPDVGAPPCTMVLFGATGDLTKRKLVPSLMNLAKDGLLDQNFAVIGVAIQPMSDD